MQRVVGEGLVVEEQVRTVKTDVEQIFFLKKSISGFLGQGFQDVLTEAVVCVCGGHDILLCLWSRNSYECDRYSRDRCDCNQ